MRSYEPAQADRQSVLYAVVLLVCFKSISIGATMLVRRTLAHGREAIALTTAGPVRRRICLSGKYQKRSDGIGATAGMTNAAARACSECHAQGAWPMSAHGCTADLGNSRVLSALMA